MQVPAAIKRPDTPEAQRVVIQDISGHGMRLATEAVCEPGTLLAVEVKLPELKAPVAVRVKVVWSRPMTAPARRAASPSAETGVTFVQLDPKDRCLLMLYARLKALPPRRITP